MKAFTQMIVNPNVALVFESKRFRRAKVAASGSAEGRSVVSPTVRSSVDPEVVRLALLKRATAVLTEK